jgi:hypothetical protein
MRARLSNGVVGCTTRCTPMVFSAFEFTPFLRFLTNVTNVVESLQLFLVRCLLLIVLNLFPFLKGIKVWEIDTQPWHRFLPPAF